MNARHKREAVAFCYNLTILASIELLYITLSVQWLQLVPILRTLMLKKKSGNPVLNLSEMSGNPKWMNEWIPKMSSSPSFYVKWRFNDVRVTKNQNQNKTKEQQEQTNKNNFMDFYWMQVNLSSFCQEPKEITIFWGILRILKGKCYNVSSFKQQISPCNNYPLYV